MARDNDFLKDKARRRLQAKTAATRKARVASTKVTTRAAAPNRNDLSPALLMTDRAIDEVKPAKRRIRQSDDEQLARLVHSLATFGQVRPILIDTDNRIVAGHSVWEALKQMGQPTINCIVVNHLSDELLRAYAIADNRTGETGNWELEALKLELDDLVVHGIDLEVTGFTLPEIDIIRLDEATVDPQADETDDEVEDGVAVTQRGDLYALGEHRLLCGDALDPASYACLMEGALAGAVVSDAPYNCPIKGFVSGLGRHKHEDFAQAVGEMTDDEFERFLESYLALCKRYCTDGAVLFAFMDWRQIDLLLSAGRSIGLSRLHVAVWNKGSGAMGSLYRSAHEFVAVFCNGERAAINNVQLGKHGRDRTSVWTYPGATRRGSSAAKALADHPTPKPVDLVADAILDVTEPGAIVLDPFLGSGTTLIAAERCSRIAYGIELDGRYVDRTIKRWEAETGLEAIHIATGLRFAELANLRQLDASDAAGADLAPREEEPGKDQA